MSRFRMYFTTAMDRSATRQHYISPGGYEFRFETGETVQFDFITSHGHIRKEDQYLVDWEVRDFDEECSSCSEARLVELLKTYGENFTVCEFFVHCGDYDDPEIEVREIRDWVIEVDDQMICVPNYIFKTEEQKTADRSICRSFAG